jgi:hypothetical protein
VFSLLYQLSYSDLHRWQDSNLRPSTYEVTRAFTTPQTLESFPYFLCLLTSFTSALAHTRRMHSPMPHRFADSLARKIPGGIVVHGVSGVEPEPCGSAREVTVNFTIPG